MDRGVTELDSHKGTARTVEARRNKGRGAASHVGPAAKRRRGG